MDMKTLYNPIEFWTESWKTTPSKPASKQFYTNIKKIFEEYKCRSVLDVGCGEAFAAGFFDDYDYTGMDFVPLDEGLNIVPYDISKVVPLPDNSFDAVFSRMTLLHVPPLGIDRAVENIKRLAKKVVVLCEYPFLGSDDLWLHCFNHDLRSKFGLNVSSPGWDVCYEDNTPRWSELNEPNVVFVDAYGVKGELKYEI